MVRKVNGTLETAAEEALLCPACPAGPQACSHYWFDQNTILT